MKEFHQDYKPPFFKNQNGTKKKKKKNFCDSTFQHFHGRTVQILVITHTIVIEECHHLCSKAVSYICILSLYLRKMLHLHKYSSQWGSLSALKNIRLNHTHDLKLFFFKSLDVFFF